MKNKMKAILGIALISGILSIVLLAAPTLAFSSGKCKGYLLQDQDRDRLRTQDCECTCEYIQEESRIRERKNECLMKRNYNYTMDSGQLGHQFRNQNGQRTSQP